MNTDPLLQRVQARMPQAGFATIAIVALLGLASTVALLGWAAAALAEQRSAAAEARALESRTAAEAGLAWALARLNENGPHDAQCRVDAAAPAISGSAGALRDRMVARQANPLPSAGVSAAALPDEPAATWACQSDTAEPSGWRCDCPLPGQAARAPAWLAAARAVANGRRAAFVVSLERQEPGLPSGGVAALSWRLVSRGCVDRDASCVSDTAQLATPGAGIRPLWHSAVSVAVVQRPAIVRMPGPAVSAVGSIHLADAGVEVVSRERISGGQALWAGGPIDTGSAQVSGLPGALPGEAMQALDTTLASQDLDMLGRSLLGAAPSDWAAFPGVVAVDCTGDAGSCSARVNDAQVRGARAVHVRGNLHWQPTADHGATGRPPVLLVVDGQITVAGPGQWSGLLLARAIALDGRSGSLRLRGALVSAGDIEAHSAVRITRDATVLDALAREPVAVVAAPGSWHEL